MNLQSRTRTLPPKRTAYIAAATLVVALAGGLTVGNAQAAAHGPGHGGMGMGMMGSAAHVDRLLDAVDASAEQRSQIKTIVQAARTDLRAQHEAGRTLRSQALQLYTQPSVDARSAEALRQQMLGQHDEASKRMMQAMLEASRVLSPEQRQKLGAMMTERRTHSDKARAPRPNPTP